LATSRRRPKTTTAQQADPEQVVKGRHLEAPCARTDSAVFIYTTMFLARRADADALRERSNGRMWAIDTGHDMMMTEPRQVAELID
jgi:hypothetical protein